MSKPTLRKDWNCPWIRRDGKGIKQVLHVSDPVPAPIKTSVKQFYSEPGSILAPEAPPMAPEELEKLIQERMATLQPEVEPEVKKQQPKVVQEQQQAVVEQQQQQQMHEDRFEQNKMEVEFNQQQQLLLYLIIIITSESSFHYINYKHVYFRFSFLQLLYLNSPNTIFYKLELRVGSLSDSIGCQVAVKTSLRPANLKEKT